MKSEGYNCNKSLNSINCDDLHHKGACRANHFPLKQGLKWIQTTLWAIHYLKKRYQQGLLVHSQGYLREGIIKISHPKCILPIPNHMILNKYPILHTDDNDNFVKKDKNITWSILKLHIYPNLSIKSWILSYVKS